MKVSVIVAHPNRDSLNRAIADKVTETLQNNGHDVYFHDLYEENFDPLLPYEEIPQDAALDGLVQCHCDELASADGIVIVHPVWWGQPPAVMKGWVDRVFRVGLAYRFEEGPAGIGTPVGMLKAEHALLINTSNTPQDIEQQVYGNSLETLWHKNILAFCGVKNFHRRLFSPVLISTPEQRKQWLSDAVQAVHEVFPRAEQMRATA